MKYILFTLTLLVGLVTSFLIWIYIQRANLVYNSEGRFFSQEDGVVYHEHAKESYGIFALIGVILSAFLIIKLIKGKIQVTNNS